MHDDVDAATDLFPDGLERQVDAAHEGHRLDAHERVRSAVRVRRRQGPAVPSVHSLQHVEGLAAADLADEDPVGTHAKRRPEKRAHVDRAGPLDARSPRFERDDVWLWKTELRCVFDGDDALAIADGEGERVERRGLAARGASRNEQASPLTYGANEIGHRTGGQRPVPDQVLRTQGTLPESTDREDGADERYRRDHRVHARTIGKPTVDERTCEIDAPSERRDEALDQDQYFLGVGEVDGGLLEAPVALDPDTACAVHHDLGHAIVAQQRGEFAETEQSVFEPAFEKPELARRDDQTLVDEGLAQRCGKLLATRSAV